MKLSFLGKSYDASTPAMDAMPSGETGTFLGQPYAKKQFTVAQRQQPSEELTYRGQRYRR